MNDLVKSNGGRAVSKFDPKTTRRKDAVLGYAIEEARKIKDWPALEEAVELKIEEQALFVGWWQGTVTPNKARKSENAERGLQTAKDKAEAETGIKQQQVSRWTARLEDRNKYRETLYGAAYHKAMAEAVEGNHRAQGTGENEWYTPDEYLDLARLVLGAFDLDPASSEAAQEKVGADRFFTKADNGLVREWNGRVWLNPPYTQPDIALFVSKMVSEWNSGRVTAAIVLTHNYTDTAWFHEAAGAADAICFTRGRIKFYSDDGSIAAPTQGQAFFYFGPDQVAFAKAFRPVGFVMAAYHGELADEAA